MKKWHLCLVMVIFLLNIMGCGGGQETKPAAEKTVEVKIGNLLPLSGGVANDGAQVRRGFDLAVEEINATGGIKSLGGAKIKMIYGDTRGEPTVGMTETEKLIMQEKVSLIIGAHQSNVTLPGTAVAEKYGVPYYVPNATSDKITEQGYKFTFRSNVKASWGSQHVIDFLVDMGKRNNDPVKNIAIVYEDTEGGQTFAAGIRAAAKKASIPIVFDEAYPHAAADLTPLVTKLKQAAPDAIVFNSYVQDAILLCNTISEMRLNTKAILGWGGIADPSFIKAVGKKSNYYFDIENWAKDMKLPAAQALADKFQKKYNLPLSAHAATGYSAVYVVKDVLELAASTDPKKIRDAFAKVEVKSGPAMVMPFTKFIFDASGQNPEARYMVTQIINGEYKTIWPVDITPETNKGVWPMPKWEDRKD